MTLIGDKAYLTILVKEPAGEKEFNAIIDTGAYKTMIPESECESLGLEKIEEREVLGICPVPTTVSIYRADVFCLGRRTVGSLIGFNIPSREAVSLVGRDILRKFNLDLNYKQNKVMIADP